MKQTFIVLLIAALIALTAIALGGGLNKPVEREEIILPDVFVPAEGECR